MLNNARDYTELLRLSHVNNTLIANFICSIEYRLKAIWKLFSLIIVYQINVPNWCCCTVLGW